jgi:hypothetical protein
MTKSSSGDWALTGKHRAKMEFKTQLLGLAAALALFSCMLVVISVQKSQEGMARTLLQQRSGSQRKNMGAQADPKGTYAISKDDLNR